MKKANKHGSLAEYIKRGGFVGIAEQYLKDELQKATTEKNHPLHVVFEACQQNGIDEANRLLITALLNAETFPLQAAALVFVKLPAIRLMLSEASNHLDLVNYTEWDKFPAEIKAWSACHLQRVEDERIWLVPKRESQKKATKAATKYTTDNYDKWNTLAIKIDPNANLTNNHLAVLIVQRLHPKLSREKAEILKMVQTIRKAIPSQKIRKIQQ